MDVCIFCKIIKREIPSQVRFEDENFLAFDDINPKAPVHIIIIPKRHIHSVKTLEATEAELMGKLIMTAQKIATEAGVKSYRLVFNSGRDAGQEVDHLHLHLLGGGKLGDIA